MDAEVKAKDRSPNYPALSLEAAVDAVRKLHKADGTTPVPQETLAKFAGHEKMSGPARSKIAGIRQYGLIEAAGPGKVRVSDRALPLFFHQPADREYQQTLKDLALMPVLFSQLFSQYSQASEATLRLHLVRDRKFSDEGAKRLARIFKENLAFAKLGTSSYNGGESEAQIEDFPQEIEEPPASPGLRAAPRGPIREAFEPKGQQLAIDAGGVSLDYLVGGIAARLSFARKPTARAVQRLMDHLNVLKADIEDEEQVPEPARLRDLEAGPRGD
jgi:hypothetical protein